MREGWQEATLGEVADFFNGYPFKPEELGTEGLPVVRIRELMDPKGPVDRSCVEVPKRCQLVDGDLIFSWSGTLAVKLWDRGPALLNQHLFRVVERPGVDRRWLASALDHAIQELSAKTHGTTMKHVTKNTLLPHRILLPPLHEQRRIVDLITAVDEAIEAAEGVCAATEQARRGLLQDLLSDERAEREGWRKVRLEGAASLVMGQSPPGSSYNTDRRGLPFIQGSAEFGPLHPSPTRWCDTPRKVAQSGDLLVSVRAPVGDVNIADRLTAIGRGLAIVRSTDSSLTGFLRLVIESRLTELRSLSSGGMFESITRAGLAGLLILLPPLDEQRRIVDLIAAVEEQREAASSLVENLREARSALLADLLSGDHEIPATYDALLST